MPHTLHDWPSDTLPGKQPARLMLKSVAVRRLATDTVAAVRETEKGTAMELLLNAAARAPAPPSEPAREHLTTTSYPLNALAVTDIDEKLA